MKALLRILKTIAETIGNDVEITARLNDRMTVLAIQANWWDIDFHSQFRLSVVEVEGINESLEKILLERATRYLQNEYKIFTESK